MKERMYRVKYLEDLGRVELKDEERDKYFPMGKYLESSYWYATAEEAWAACAKDLAHDLFMAERKLHEIAAVVDG